VKKTFEVRRFLRLPRNAKGRDLVVGDLHGHRSLLERELEQLGFDPSRDRVLSVGDLINRGPESIATLALITQPWFYAVLGNHELMLLNFLGYYASRMHSKKSFSAAGGEWIKEAVAKDRKAVARLADGIASLPVAIHVESDVSFNVTHADLHPIGSRQHNLMSEETICVHEADTITSSRGNVSLALKSDLLGLRFGRHSVQISSTPLGHLPITYVGHSRFRDVTVHHSYVYIDQGIGVRVVKRGSPTPPTVLDHSKFAYWLGGVATARAGATTASMRTSAGAVPNSVVLA